MAASKMSDSERCDKQLRSGISKSYYHHVDSRFPKCYLTLPELYKRTADMNTDRGITWHYPSARMTYTQLYEEAQKVAKGLLHAGISRGDVVMSIGVDGPNSFILFMAVSTVGAIFSAPYFHPPLATSLQSTLFELKPKLVLIGHAPIGWEVRDSYKDILQVVKDIQHKNSSQQVILADDLIKIESEGHVKGFSDIKITSRLDVKLSESISLVTENEPCLFTSSSGTTGKPKWILVGAALFTNAGLIRKASRPISKSTKAMTANICTEEFMMLEDCLAGLHYGYEMVVLPSLTTWNAHTLANELVAILSTHQPDYCACDQSILTHLVNHPEHLNSDQPSSVCIEIGGSRTSAGFIQSLLNQWPNATQGYGLTESFYSAAAGPGDMVRKPGTSGKVAVNFEAKVVDDACHCVPWGDVGELWLRSESSFLEYKGQPEFTQSMKTADGWLKTGDLCKMDEDGYLYIMGRIKGAERFKVYGNVVYAKAIEDIMSTMAGVKQIVAVGRNIGTIDGDEICYCIELLEEVTLTKEQVYQYAVDNMNQTNEWPVRVFFCNKFPLHGARSKVSKKKLLEEVVEKVAADADVGLIAKSN